MSIESNIIRSNVQKTTNWSGGRTTELWIWPENANFADRQFDCRISTAIVEIEESTFTPFPGFLRHLMILEGKLALQHNGGSQIDLEPFQVDVFDGADETTSKGCVRDFNVMLSDGYEAKLQALSVDTETWMPLAYEAEFLHFIYCFKGTVQVQIEQKDKMQRHFLYEGDAFFLEGQDAVDNLLAFQIKGLKSAGTAIHVVVKKL